MIGEPGPFRIIGNIGDNAPESPRRPPRRRYDCQNYSTCLNIACALNWDSFTCRGCCADVSEALKWRAHQALKKDGVANSLCELPEIHYHENCDNPVLVSAVGKRQSY
ncbi:MAG: hypothetical protein KDD42_05750 [Bdellovibrionales bacterium]|nr:hypothetical protein [Bdellovibrionales bacterium]